jgi:hypothetical protein
MLFSEWVVTTANMNGSIVDRAVQRGELHASVNKAAIVTLIGSVLFYRLIVEGRKPDRELADTVSHLIQTLTVRDQGEPS